MRFSTSLNGMKIFAALSAAACLALPSVAGAQNNGYPSYAVASQQSVKGTISGFNGQYTVFVQDEKGYTDNIQLHDGTVINPTGLRLQEGMRVTVYGYPNGSVFQAYRIDTQLPANYGYQGGYGQGGYGYGGDPYGGYGYGGYGYGGYPGYGYGNGYGYGPWAPFWGIGIGWWGGGWGWPGYGCCFGNPIFFNGPIIIRRGPGVFHGTIYGQGRGGTIHGGTIHGGTFRGGPGEPPRGGTITGPVRGGMEGPRGGGISGPVRGGGGRPPTHGTIHGGRP
jgi:hypothetical protein